jgi:hypothetical protein
MDFSSRPVDLLITVKTIESSLALRLSTYFFPQGLFKQGKGPDAGEGLSVTAKRKG